MRRTRGSENWKRGNKMSEDLKMSIEYEGGSVETSTGQMRQLVKKLKGKHIQTEMTGVGERTELGQKAFDVLEQKQKIVDEQEKLVGLTEMLMKKMRDEGKDSFRASGHLFTIAELGEKLKITKG